MNFTLYFRYSLLHFINFCIVLLNLTSFYRHMYTHIYIYCYSIFISYTHSKSITIGTAQNLRREHTDEFDNFFSYLSKFCISKYPNLSKLPHQNFVLQGICLQSLHNKQSFCFVFKILLLLICFHMKICTET